MNDNSSQLGMGVRIGVGFVAVLVLMVALGATGLRYVSQANQRLKDITQNNNVKTELATEMHIALRERALSMHLLPILTDPFDKDSEIQRFNALGTQYSQARVRLEDMPLNQEEADILARIRESTRLAQPEVQAVVDMAMNNGDQAEIFERIGSVAIPHQRAVAEQVSALLMLQRQQTAQAVQEAETSYAQVRDLMLLLGSAALVIGITIAGFVSRRVSRQARQLALQAMFDPLTGLANRALLHDRIEREIVQSKRANTSFGVALMDLDRFKAVNDTLGHEVGDELLREVGRRLKDTVRAEDTVARLGGDEFVLVLDGLDEDSVVQTAEKVLSALDEPFLWHGQSIDVSASLGISLFPSQCRDTSALLRCADLAMYAAKRSGQGHVLYTQTLESDNYGELSLRSELREAIQSDQLCLHYQPQIDHRSQRVVGLEALVRWNHPQRGFLMPDAFIAMAEGAGLIGALTHWVLKTALTQQAALRRQGQTLTMAVNLSARNLHDLGFPESVRALLADSGVPPQDLCLEVTESAVMANPGVGLSILSELDSMGVTIAIDDFGTGYSSLSYLKRLPVDELKIDRAFVMEMTVNDSDDVIVRSTIDLAHNLGLKVTAEGVETAAAWNRLCTLGCDRSQGYFMARPMPVDQLERWLGESPWARAPTSGTATNLARYGT